MLGVYGFAGEIPFGFVFFSIFDLLYQQKKTHLYYSHRALQSRFHLEIISGNTKIHRTDLALWPSRKYLSSGGWSCALVHLANRD